jgi:vancomycin resistance protein YoaR
MQRNAGSAWRKGLLGLGGIIALGGTSLGIASASYEPTAAPVSFEPFFAEGKTRQELHDSLLEWWEEAGDRPLGLNDSRLTSQPGHFSARDLGVDLDIEGTLDQLAYEGLLPVLWRQTGWSATLTLQDKVPVFSFQALNTERLQAWISENSPDHRPASIDYVDGQIVHQPEMAGYLLLDDELSPAVVDALLTGQAAQLPISDDTKEIEDELLLSMDAVVGEFRTTFNSRKINRSKNIELAAAFFDGKFLMPGESIGFNETVGKRTSSRGFRLAGVYIAGQHDTAIGGGICQVSTTLYNAALLAGLEIEERYCHSLAVPYVPVGRDATVSWPWPELRIKNNSENPFALAVQYEKGALTFRFIGQSQPGREVKIERVYLGSRTHETKYVHDPTLGFGEEIEIDEGGKGHKVRTARVTYQDGVEILREDLGISSYSGGPKVIARNEDLLAPPVEDPFKDLGGLNDEF